MAIASGPRARVRKGMDRKQQSVFIQELLKGVELTYDSAAAILKANGIKVGDNTIYSHLKRAKAAQTNGHTNGHVVTVADLYSRVLVVERAVKQCGSLAALKETITLIEKAQGMR